MKKKNRFQTVPEVLLALAVICMAGVMSRMLPEQETAPVTDTIEMQKSEMIEGLTSVTEEIPVMEVHFLDVGQGDSTLIINGEHAMLIDAGDNDHGTAVQYYLQKMGITGLDYLVLTHNDADHIGGGDVVITKFDVETVFMTDYEKSNRTYRDVMSALDYKNLEWSTPEVGSVYSLGDAVFTILAPVEHYEDSNNNSIALLLEKGNMRFLFTGDAEEEAEADIVAYCAEAGLDISTDVYQAGHHGSSTSSTQVLMDEIVPAYAVISCGRDNSHGYPHAEIRKSFEERGIQVFRTDEQGSIVAVTDGENIIWRCNP